MVGVLDRRRRVPLELGVGSGRGTRSPVTKLPPAVPILADFYDKTRVEAEVKARTRAPALT